MPIGQVDLDSSLIWSSLNSLTLWNLRLKPDVLSGQWSTQCFTCIIKFLLHTRARACRVVTGTIIFAWRRWQSPTEKNYLIILVKHHSSPPHRICFQQWCSGPARARPKGKYRSQPKTVIGPGRADFQRKLSNFTLYNYRSVEQLIWLGRVRNKSILSNFDLLISQSDGLYLLFVIWLSINVLNCNARQLFLLFRSAGLDPGLKNWPNRSFFW